MAHIAYAAWTRSSDAGATNTLAMLRAVLKAHKQLVPLAKAGMLASHLFPSINNTVANILVASSQSVGTAQALRMGPRRSGGALKSSKKSRRRAAASEDEDEGEDEFASTEE
ncbi:hypothetical protein MBLNU13_g01771t2 [Cladosporium sp. NU13]